MTIRRYIMKKVIEFLKGLLKAQKGQTAIEYALIIGGLSLLLFGAFSVMTDGGDLDFGERVEKMAKAIAAAIAK
jgi:Flp pilus assembly pilin Flp